MCMWHDVNNIPVFLFLFRHVCKKKKKKEISSATLCYHIMGSSRLRDVDVDVDVDLGM